MNTNNIALGKRIASIDIVRGLIMIVMALDHTRDFFHQDALLQDPLDLKTTTTALFFTRWITHFCAPGFVFLSGLSIYLTGLKKSINELQTFLVKRGIWLVLVEVVVMTLILTLNPAYNMIFLSVLWAIGMSMIILGLIIKLSYKTLLIIGLTIFLGHNILDFEPLLSSVKGSVIMSFLFGAPGFFPITAKHVFLLSYSVLCWTGIMILGYCTGKFFTQVYSPAHRRKILLRLGVTLIGFFVVLRTINIYGDPIVWTRQDNFLFTLLSFLNVSKYPPSLLFGLLTIGVLSIVLSASENISNWFSKILIVYGRVPFFYFLLHFLLIRLLNVLMFFVSGFSVNEISSAPFYFRPENFGYSLPVVYAIWILVVLLCFPLCRIYGNYKRASGKWWLSYL